jgi:hypothetical protein
MSLKPENESSKGRKGDAWVKNLKGSEFFSVKYRR